MIFIWCIREKIVSLYVVLKIMKFKCLILFLLFTCVACERYEDCDVELVHDESWDVDFTLASGNCVVYKDTLYVLFGREEGGDAENPSTIFRYAAMSDLGNFVEEVLPIKPRVNATAIVVASKLYAGLGFKGRAYGYKVLLRDWWEYDFVSKEWRQLADFLADDVVAPIVWEDGGYIYLALGFAENFKKNVYRYDVSNDKWELVDSLSGLFVRAEVVGAKVNDCIYFGSGCGIEMRNDWWRYDWKKKELLECAKLPFKGRIFASSVAIDDFIYVLGGRYFGGSETREHFYETIIVYDIRNDEWLTLGCMQQAAENMIAFEYGGDLYWGLGQCQDGSFVRKIYRRHMK